MKTFIFILFCGVSANAAEKNTYKISIASGVHVLNETIVANEARKMHPFKTGSKKNLCMLMKNDNKSATIYCRSFPKIPSGPKDKNYVEITQLVSCESADDTNLGMTDVESGQSIMIKVSCEPDKT